MVPFYPHITHYPTDTAPATCYLTTSGGDGCLFGGRLHDGDYTVRRSREGDASEVKTGSRLKYPFRAVVEVTMEPGEADLSAAGDAATGARERAARTRRTG